MGKDIRTPDLSFPDVQFGAIQTPWNLDILLYVGGAQVNARRVRSLIESGKLGAPVASRVDLVVKCHDELRGMLASGAVEVTCYSHIKSLRTFFAWADSAAFPLTLDSAHEAYLKWADELLRRTRLKNRTHGRWNGQVHAPLSMMSAYSFAATVGTMLDRVLEHRRHSIEMTRLYRPSTQKTAVGVKEEKQSLRATFAFGHMLQDICDRLDITATLSEPLPIRIALRNGKEIIRHGHSGGRDYLSGDERALGSRYPLANLRVEAELLMFIAQTGMNLEQARHLEMRNFSFSSYLDGYQVRDRKARRGGMVLFEIFKDFRPHLERYLEWRRKMFPNSTALFPFVRTRGALPKSKFLAHRVRVICQDLGMEFVGPRMLRATRVNWLLRKSADPDLTAEMAQHTKATLLKVYDRPSLQRAMIETTRFWCKADPGFERSSSIAPGGCNGVPAPVKDIPKIAPKPNCQRAAGCLWCENHRDIDSIDYLWALASFGHLKSLEVGKSMAFKTEHEDLPARATATRIYEKLRWFEQSNELRRSWAVEVQARIEEGEFHPDWRSLIVELEGGAQ